jgi:aminoglycoside 6-adenylyltransferase
MRTEAEILDLILKYAADHDAVRVVVLNGSRVNPKVAPDRYQDFDVVYFVEDVAPFRGKRSIVTYFGEPMIVQLPEDMGDPPPQGDGHYVYLMQFMDGNRIDLSIKSLSALKSSLEDSLTKVLLDKDGLVGKRPRPSDRSYLPKRPTRKQYEDCCNEFWWLNPYVAKGLARNELPYAKHMLDVVMRPQLMKMLVWQVGSRTRFEVSVGKFGGRLREHLDPTLWVALRRTYAGCRKSSNWNALVEMECLFSSVARQVGRRFGYSYPEQDDKRVSAYIQSIRTSRTIRRA